MRWLFNRAHTQSQLGKRRLLMPRGRSVTWFHGWNTRLARDIGSARRTAPHQYPEVAAISSLNLEIIVRNIPRCFQDEERVDKKLVALVVKVKRRACNRRIVTVMVLALVAWPHGRARRLPGRNKQLIVITSRHEKVTSAKVLYVPSQTA